MNGVLRTLLEGVVDYAGLFPPAKLPLSQAIDEYLRFSQGGDAWFVDRFACGVGKLGDLAAALVKRKDEPFLPVSVIGVAQTDPREWKNGLEQDAAEMAKFEEAADGLGEVQAYEIRVPDHQDLAARAGELLQFRNIDLFVELPWGAGMLDSLAALTDLELVSAKVRTGGLRASDFPSSAELAEFVQQCAQLDLSFKLTAGLHHPLPTTDPATGAKMHGFWNLLCATALTLSGDLSRREMEMILEETSPKAFVIRRESLVWRDHKATMEDLENARTLFTAFGSCSVAEPLEGLDRLGLLEKAGR